MARGMWKGNISFGLVTIPVSVISAENNADDLDFDMLDKRDNAHIGYQKINKKTGEVVSNEDIVKGLKLDSGKYAIFNQEELKDLRLKGTSSIDIQQFIEIGSVDPRYFRKTYYLSPQKGGEKTYILLRETLKKTDKYAVGLIVLHGRQQLVLIGTTGPALTLYSIHYSKELREPSREDFPAAGLSKVKISPREIAMAEKLVDELSDKWRPESFKDTYFQEIKTALKKKSRKKVHAAEQEGDSTEADEEALSRVLDLMPLLEKSLRSRKTSKSSSSKSKRKAAR
jgi:DNA end-binding protein Ku